MTFRLMLVAASFAVSASSAFADGEVQKLITGADMKRLDNYDQIRAEAVDEAKRKGAPEDIETLDAILDKPLVSFSGFDMTGSWRCRTIKVGGGAELIVYGWFKCRVADDGSGWRLAKLSGSQRTTGRFYNDGDERLIYLGSYSVHDEKPNAYGAGPKTDQVGYAFRTGDEGWRIEFPDPYYSSKLDILQFRR